MKTFMGEDFLLENETAKKLFDRYAKNMPIYDYHCHLSSKEIAEDKKYENITKNINSHPTFSHFNNFRFSSADIRVSHNHKVHI